jgi:hypothetical protein
MSMLESFFKSIASLLFRARPQPNVRVIEYPDMCDPSAAMAINDSLFIAASDEDNVLRVYVREKPGTPQRFDLNPFLKPDEDHPEADIEGVTQLGGRMFWITSHGRNRNGKLRTSRHRLFATKVTVEGDKIDVLPVGLPYTRLLEDLVRAPALKKYDLESASQKAPESKGGLNIEGFVATPQGALLIGFRNPIPGGKALIVPIDNPQQVIEGARAAFGPPIELALNGLGIRSFEYIVARQHYLIAAGPYDDDGKATLFRWSGDPSDDAQLIPEIDFGDLAPEAMFIYPGDTTVVQFLSDDGGKQIDGVECKDLVPAMRRFRTFSLEVW